MGRDRGLWTEVGVWESEWETVGVWWVMEWLCKINQTELQLVR